MTSDPTGASHAKPEDVRPIWLGYALVLALQVWLVFNKSINWDEFYHFSQIYELRDGRLDHDLQVLHARLFAWVPGLPLDLLTKMQVARFCLLLSELVTLAAIIGLVRHYLTREAALLAGLAYATAGYVFLHAFSIRADPFATAALMTALYLLAVRPLTLSTMLGISALVGIAGLATIKSVLYLPCFVGLALYRLVEVPNWRPMLARFAVLAVLTGLAFFLFLEWHRAELGIGYSAFSSVTYDRSRFFAEGLFPKLNYMIRQALFAPVVTIAIVMAPLFWRKLGSKRAMMAMLGLYLPLATLAIYRNSFPYYYVFLLAPVMVATAASLDALRDRYGLRWIVGLLLATPLVLTLIEPRDTLERQRATIALAQTVYPDRVGYLSWTGMVPEYPRVITFLTSGIGIENYYRNADPIIARGIDEGRVLFVIADHSVLSEALEGRPIPKTLLPQDIAALRDNFQHHAGLLWLLAKKVCGPAPALTITVGGPYTLQGGPLVIDGKTVTAGQTISLERGVHPVEAPSARCVTLWGGNRLPPPPSRSLDGLIYTNF